MIDEPAHQRYIAQVGGRPAGVAAYRLVPARVIFTHTEIDPEFGGGGVGTSLASAALDDVRSRGLSVTPECPFIAGFIGRHPAYQDLVVGGGEGGARPG